MTVDTAQTLSYINYTYIIHNNSGHGRKRIDMKQNKYYTLAVDFGSGYGAEFGSFEKMEVVAELVCNKSNYAFCTTEILKTSPKQSAIDAAINKLNNKG